MITIRPAPKKNLLKEYLKQRKQKSTNRSSGFKVGHIPSKRKKLGSEVDKQGSIYVKTSQPAGWRLKHNILWEKIHGRPKPKGRRVIFIDGNNRNFSKENIQLSGKNHLLKQKNNNKNNEASV